MFMQLPLKGLKPTGNKCQETGAKIGKATLSSMAKHSPLKSPPVMDVPSPPSTWRLLIGLSARPTLVRSSLDNIWQLDFYWGGFLVGSKMVRANFSGPLALIISVLGFRKKFDLGF